MGYMGLSHYGESDTAFDLAHDIYDEVAKALMHGLKDKGNEFNTDGPVNVALFFEATLIKDNQAYSHDKLKKVANKTKKLLELKIKQDKKDLKKYSNKKDRENYKFHISSYKRMVSSLNKFLGES